MPAVENHGLGISALTFLAIDVEPHGETLRVLDLILGDEPRPERAKSLATLAFGPLPRALDLKHALGYVVGKAVSGDNVECFVFAEITRPLADDDAKLDLPIEFA